MRELATGLGGIALLVALALGLGLALDAAYRRARAKGYAPPAAALVVLAGLVAGVAASAWWGQAAGRDSMARLFAYVFYLPILAAAAAGTLLAQLLPARQARTFGPRRPGFPFARVGQGIIGLGLVAIAAVLGVALTRHLGAREVGRALEAVTGLLVPTGLYFLYLARRARVRPPKVLAQAGPLGALYLRAFDEESQFFVIGPKSALGAYARGWSATLARPHQNVGVTFEEYFAAALSRELGPFVALGSPRDWLAPEGAARLYAKDAEWTERFAELAGRAACIAVEVGRSDNLGFELEHLRRAGLQTRVFVFTRPRPEPGTRLAYAFFRLVGRLRGIAQPSWDQLAARLARLAYHPGEDPGPGAVVTFDAEGRGLLLTSEASTPAEYVGPIADWIRRRERTGRCEPVACATCGVRFHAAPGASAPAECRACAAERVLAARSPRQRWLDGAIRWLPWLAFGSPVPIMGVLVALPATPWLEAWVGWLFLGAWLAVVALPFAVAQLLADGSAP